jgi:hypothetical protein
LQKRVCKIFISKILDTKILSTKGLGRRDLKSRDRHCLDQDCAIFLWAQGWMSQGGCGKSFLLAFRAVDEKPETFMMTAW